MANRWIDQTQPQTLVMATIILYLNAGIGLLTGQIFSASLGPLLIVAEVLGALGIANEKKLGYWVAVGAAVASVAQTVYFFSFGAMLTLIFYVALVALLLHPQSRSYRRTWFR